MRAFALYRALKRTYFTSKKRDDDCDLGTSVLPANYKEEKKIATFLQFCGTVIHMPPTGYDHSLVY